MRHALLCAAALSAACATTQSAEQKPTPATEQTSAQAGSGIRFIENDLAGALAEAKAQGKPLFVDAWAPW